MSMDNDVMSAENMATAANAVGAGSMGIVGRLWTNVSNSTAMVVVCVAFGVVLYWNRQDTKEAVDAANGTNERLIGAMDKAAQERTAERKENAQIHREAFKELTGDIKKLGTAVERLTNKIPDEPRE